MLGCGADVVYPAGHSGLYRAIRERGAVATVFPFGAQPDRGSFPRRNGIISGLSLGVVVVEAPAKSGSLITVTHATEQSREVFTVPGDVRSGLSAGCHQLLRDGAKLVEKVDDVVEELGHWRPPGPMSAPALAPEDECVYALLSREPRHIDDLARGSTLPPAGSSRRIAEAGVGWAGGSGGGKAFLAAVALKDYPRHSSAW